MLAVAIAALGAAATFAPVTAPKVENVVYLFTDGLRWQDIYGGADPELIKTLKPDSAAYKAYWRETPEARRAALFPFLWSTAIPKGQAWGNRDAGSNCQVLNGLKFSYPGYSEGLQGFADPTIRSNDPIPNQNVTVFEWLNGRPGFKDRVAAFGNWYVVNAIFNKERCGFYVQSGMDPITFEDTRESRMFNELQRDTDHPFGPDDPADAFTFQASMMYIKAKRPRVLGVLFGETDSWAHSGSYERYLNAAHRFDQWVASYWNLLQSMPQYRDKTALVLSTDHGRGDGPQWTSHGESVTNAENTWIIVMGPTTPALGVRRNATPVNTGQIAASIAALVGENYNAAQSKAQPPLPDLAKP